MQEWTCLICQNIMMLPDIWQFQGKIIYFKTIFSSQVLFQDFPSILIFSYIFFEISLLYKCSFKLEEGLPLGKIFFINQIWKMKFTKHHSIMATVLSTRLKLPISALLTFFGRPQWPQKWLQGSESYTSDFSLNNFRWFFCWNM